MDKQKKKDKIFINKNAGDVTKGIEMFNKSMTFNTQSSAQEELNQRVANNDISSEETYDILNRISELRDEAEKEDDHNNPMGAIKLHKEADKLQETKTKKTTIRECLNKMDLQASDDGFRGITLVDLYEACTLTKDDKNHLIKMLQTTDDAEKVREFLSNKCEFEDIPEDDIDAEVQLECTKSDWEKLNDLDEGYKLGDERVLDPDSEEYKKFEKIAYLLNEANIIHTSGRYKGERAYFFVEDVYLDLGLDWKWTTIVREDNVQVLSPADWLSIINDRETPEEIVNKIVTNKYSGVQFANESQLGEASYGGAYDIADDQYFTREELNEFGEDVVDNLNSLAYSKAELESIFIENNIIEITVTWDGNEITVEQPIDMRRIRKPKDLDKYRVRVISKMKPELEELGFDFGPHLRDGDYELSEAFDTELRDKLVQMWFEENTADWLVKNEPATAEWLAYGGATTDDFAEVEQEVLAKLNGEEDHKEAEWKRLLTKSVNDSDGFLTDYSMWYNDGEKRWVFIFGDSDIYDPTNTDPDWETEDPEEARQWFLDYKGFEDDEDLNENKTMNEAREYYILPVENLIGSERRELSYYDLEMIGRKGLVTYIEGTYPDLSDYARNVLDFDLEEDDPMLTLSSEWDEELDEDVVKQGNKWVNKGKEGTHGTFKTKKDALKQTRAMYARGYKK